MKAIVHIGTEKTGTTSIQRFLFHNKKKLRAGGFHFLQSAGKTNNRALPAYFVAENLLDDFYRDEGITTLEAKEAFRKTFLQKFEQEIATLPRTVHTVVISSEHFHSRIRTPSEMDKVHEFLSTYFDDIKIVCYVRDQVSTCASYYSTALKSGNPASFNDFFQRCKPENYYFNYFEVLSNWERCFGFASLDVSLFSRSSFLNNSLLDDFTAKLDPALIGVLDSKIEIENESLTPVGQALARGLNLAFPLRTSTPEVASVRDKCKLGVYKKYRGTGRQPSLAMQQKIYNDFIEVNELLRKKYFPHLKSMFDPPAGEPVPVTGNEQDFIEGVGYVLNELKKIGKNVVLPEDYAGITRHLLDSVLSMFRVENKSRKEGIDTAISREDLRLLMIAARKIESRDLKLARDLMTLVLKIDPTLHGVKTVLDAYKKREDMAKKSRYQITYTGAVESPNAEERERQSVRFQDWLMSFFDCIEGSAINVLKDTNLLRMEGAGVSQKATGLAGFTVIRVDSEEAAYSIATRCPHLHDGGTVFVSEVLQPTPNS